MENVQNLNVYQQIPHTHTQLLSQGSYTIDVL